jgi:hypothetical protein
MPIDESSSPRSSGGYQTKMSPLSPGRPSSLVVRPPVAEFGADADDEHRPLFPTDLVLALARRKLRVAPPELFAVDEMNHRGQERAGQRRVVRANLPLELPDRPVDAADDLFQERHRSVLRADHAFPIPLIDIERVQVVEDLVGPDRVHVRVEPLARRKPIVGERHAFPFGQRLHDLPLFLHRLDRETRGLLDAIQVIVDPGVAQHDERRRHPGEIEGPGQISLEQILDEFDGFLALAQRERLFVAGGDREVTVEQAFVFHRGVGGG